MKKFIVLISGRGSNLDAMCKRGLSPHIACVISNKSNATGLMVAKSYNIKTHIVESDNFLNNEDFEAEIIEIINNYSIDFIALAGFMKILSPNFVAQYPGKIINIHPSILPAFKGANAQKNAFNHKVKLSGATVHFVDEKLDNGLIIAQGMVGISACTSQSQVSETILELEHVLYPFIINKFIHGNIHLHENSVIVEHDSNDDIHLGDYANYIFY